MLRETWPAIIVDVVMWSLLLGLLAWTAVTGGGW
jgi:hypothetical protein